MAIQSKPLIPSLNIQGHGCIHIWLVNVKVAPSAPSKLHVEYGLLVGDPAQQRYGGMLSVHGEEFYGSNRKIDLLYYQPLIRYVGHVYVYSL